MGNEAIERSAYGKGHIMRLTIDGIYDPNPFVNLGRDNVLVVYKGDSPDPPSSSLADTKTRKYIRSEIYPMVQRGLEGEGFGTPGFIEDREQTSRKGLAESYGTAKSELSSQLVRTLDPRDTRVKNFAMDTLEREFITKQDDISRVTRAEKVADTDLSMAMAGEYLAGEKRMSISAGQVYNQAVQSNIGMQQQLGTFGTNVASGLGTGMADYYYAQKMGTV